MPEQTLDRLIRKEVALGTIRELEPPTTHIGLQVLAPWQEVATDDVIFDYATGLTDGMAPARAEDAESELAQKDLIWGGTGRASIIDWAVKDHYKPSDVNRYREALLIESRLGVNGVKNGADVPVTIRAMKDEFQAKLARDDALRRRKLDNRVEWLIMQALENSQITYNDGKVKFTVAYGRPSNQSNQAPGGGLWSLTTSDPIGDINAMNDWLYSLYGVRMGRAITSRRVLNALANSDRFIARAGMVVGGTPSSPIDLDYIADGWGPKAAQEVIERQTGVQFIEYDAVFRTRAVGSQTFVNTRFLSDNKVYFLPRTEDVAELDDMIGFGKTLTSPHPEGNWTPGFYEWETPPQQDPWGIDRGSGVKAFPVFPHLEWTYTMTVLA